MVRIAGLLPRPERSNPSEVDGGRAHVGVPEPREPRVVRHGVGGGGHPRRAAPARRGRPRRGASSAGTARPSRTSQRSAAGTLSASTGSLASRTGGAVGAGVAVHEVAAVPAVLLGVRPLLGAPLQAPHVLQDGRRLLAQRRGQVPALDGDGARTDGGARGELLPAGRADGDLDAEAFADDDLRLLAAAPQKAHTSGPPRGQSAATRPRRVDAEGRTGAVRVDDGASGHGARSGDHGHRARRGECRGGRRAVRDRRAPTGGRGPVLRASRGGVHRRVLRARAQVRCAAARRVGTTLELAAGPHHLGAAGTRRRTGGGRRRAGRRGDRGDAAHGAGHRRGRRQPRRDRRQRSGFGGDRGSAAGELDRRRPPLAGPRPALGVVRLDRPRGPAVRPVPARARRLGGVPRPRPERPRPAPAHVVGVVAVGRGGLERRLQARRRRVVRDGRRAAAGVRVPPRGRSRRVRRCRARRRCGAGGLPR